MTVVKKKTRKKFRAFFDFDFLLRPGNLHPNARLLQSLKDQRAHSLLAGGRVIRG
jgi:hypothetical protein